MSKVKIILLDLGGVVFQSTGISNQKINWDTISILNKKYGAGLNTGRKGSFEAFLEEYNELTTQELSGKGFLKSVFDTLELNQQLIDFIKSTWKIVIVSDNYRENIEYISNRYHFNEWAIHQIYSFDYKMHKSNPLFFQRLLKDLKYKNEEMIFIDDDPNNIEMAKKCGIVGLQYKNNEQIKMELEKYRL